VVEQVREGEAAQRHAQVGHVGEVGLGELAGRMDLGEVDLPLRAVQRPPRLDVPLQRAQLRGLVAPGMLRAEQLAEGLRLQRVAAFELGDDPGPVVEEGIRARPGGAGAFELAGQRAGLFVLAGGALTHAGAGRRLDLGAAFLAFSQQELYLGVCLHGVLPSSQGKAAMVQSPPARCFANR